MEAVFRDAFHHYPVMRFVLGPGGDYEDRLERLIHLFVMARILRGEPVYGVDGDAGEGLRAAATTSFPGAQASPPEFEALRADVWAHLGPEARARYEACGAAWAPLGVDVPHLHLNMIGVRRAHQGSGLSRALLEEVHRLARESPGAQGVTLTTEEERNVAFYRHMGYEVTGRARIGPGVETWGFVRRF